MNVLLRNKKLKQASITSLIKVCGTTNHVPLAVTIPSTIEARFREDYDIIHVDRIVVAKIAEDYEESRLLLITIQDLESKLLEPTVRTHKSVINRKLASLRERYIVMSNTDRLSVYRENAREYLEAYSEIGSPYRSIDIMSKKEDMYTPTENDLLRIYVIKSYLEVASQYIDVNMSCTGERPSSNPSLCEECGENIANILPTTDGLVECPRCPAIKYVKTTGSSPDNHSSCEDLANFIKALHRYQGKIVPKINIEDARIKLDNHFMKTGKMVSDDVRLLPCGPRGDKAGTSVQIMLKAMHDEGIKCYSDVYYMCNYVWGWTPFDISGIEDVLIEDYKKTQAAWYSMPRELKQRESSLPIWYRVYQHLLIRLWNCLVSDFKIPKNVSHYNDSWRYMCMNSGDPTIVYRGM
jgi:hypothetical protein